MPKTKSRLRLVNSAEQTSGQPEGAAVKPRINNDRLCKELTIIASVYKIRICFVEHVDYYGEKAYGVYKAGKECYMIFIDKHLKGRELRFNMARELGYVISCVDRFGHRFWKIPVYRKELQDQAIKWATDVLRIWQPDTNFQQLKRATV